MIKRWWRQLIRKAAKASADPVIELFQPTRSVLIEHEKTQLLRREEEQDPTQK